MLLQFLLFHLQSLKLGGRRNRKKVSHTEKGPVTQKKSQQHRKKRVSNTEKESVRRGIREAATGDLSLRRCVCAKTDSAGQLHSKTERTKKRAFVAQWRDSEEDKRKTRAERERAQNRQKEGETKNRKRERERDNIGKKETTHTKKESTWVPDTDTQKASERQQTDTQA